MACDILPTSSSVCIIFLMRVASGHIFRVFIFARVGYGVVRRLSLSRFKKAGYGVRGASLYVE